MNAYLGNILTIKTELTVVNETGTDIISTIVEEIERTDWWICPADNFQNVEIRKQGRETRLQEINRFASGCPFTMTLVFQDGTKEKLRVNQKYAVGMSDPGFFHREGKRNIMFHREGVALVITVKD